MINKIKTNILPILFLYLSLLCLYVAYLHITRDYNITKSIYQPYKTFLQISTFSYNNYFIAPIKGFLGLTGFIIYLVKNKNTNMFYTLFLVMSIVEIIIIFSFQFFLLKEFSNYINQTGVVFTAVLFSVLGFFYFKDFKMKKQVITILSGIFLTIISYDLH